MSKKQKTNKPAASASSSKGQEARKRNERQSFITLVVVTAVLLVMAIFLKPKASQAAEISTAQAYEKYQQGLFFLDVRTQEEWDQMHLAKSTLIPLEDLESRLSELPKDQEIVVVCRSGNRSNQALAVLQKGGITNASSMAGGLNEWKTAGYPLEAGGQ